MSAESDSTRTIARPEDQETLNQELEKAKSQPPCIIVVRGTPQGKRIFLNQSSMIIGRSPTVDVSFSSDASISKQHSELKLEGDKSVTIQDLSSRNGTFVNDKKLPPQTPTRLEKEDMIRVGNTILKFLPAGEFEILMYGALNLAANTDPMTGAYNKGYFSEAIEAEFKRAKALQNDLSLMFLDLDHFKKINDTFGHQAGDYVLKETCHIVSAHFLNPKDILARYGGEEFVIIMGGTNGQAALERAEKMRVAIQNHAFEFEGKHIKVTTSIGVSELRTDIETSQRLIKIADEAVYEAKASGRNKVICGS